MVSRDHPGAPPARLPLLPGRLTPRLRFGAVVVLLLIAAAIAVMLSAVGSHGSSTPIQSLRSSTAPPATIDVPIYVHVLGAIAEPGLYTLPEGSRVIDGVAAAGGFTADADRAALNLARFLSDGEQLSVPKLGEAPPVALSPPGIIGGKVNLNTADAQTLETLPRVGPAMSARIIAWREANGRFATIEDLQSISGIGDKTFAALRDLVTV